MMVVIGVVVEEEEEDTIHIRIIIICMVWED